jgi:hypothetical protein
MSGSPEFHVPLPCDIKRENAVSTTYELISHRTSAVNIWLLLVYCKMWELMKSCPAAFNNLPYDLLEVHSKWSDIVLFAIEMWFDIRENTILVSYWTLSRISEYLLRCLRHVIWSYRIWLNRSHECLHSYSGTTKGESKSKVRYDLFVCQLILCHFGDLFVSAIFEIQCFRLRNHSPSVPESLREPVSLHSRTEFFSVDDKYPSVWFEGSNWWHVRVLNKFKSKRIRIGDMGYELHPPFCNFPRFLPELSIYSHR